MSDEKLYAEQHKEWEDRRAARDVQTNVAITNWILWFTLGGKSEIRPIDREQACGAVRCTRIG